MMRREFERLSESMENLKGHQVLEAKDGMEAVNICEEQDFDVIVMDIMMPKTRWFFCL